MQQITRLYRTSDGALIQIADDFINSAERDETQLEELGFTPLNRTTLKNARDAFSNSPSDMFLMGAMMIATQAKNTLRKELTHSTRQITGLAKVHFGEYSGEYRQFDNKELSKQTDNDLVRVCRGVLRATNLYATEMASEGIIAPKIVAYEALINSFDTSVDEQQAAVRNRDQSVYERITLGNALYELLVVLATKGKLCWIDVNEALYNDYIIYTSNSTTAQVVEGDITGGGTVVSTSITDATANTVLEITNTGNVPLTCFFAALPTDGSAPQEVMIAPNATETYPAAALGYSAQATRFNIVNNAMNVGSYRVAWQ